MGGTELSLNPDAVAHRKKVFLEQLSLNGGNALRAARAVGYADTRALLYMRKKDPEFDRAWDDAIQASNDVLEACAIERATIGTEETIFYQGMPVGSKRNYSDGLLTTMLKARKPKEYSDKKEVTGVINHKVGVALIPMRVSEDEWSKTALPHDEPVAALPAPATAQKVPVDK